MELQSRRLFEAIPIPMLIYSMDTLSFLRVNRAAVERYGFSREEWLTMTVDDIRPPEDVPECRQAVAEARRTNLPARALRRHRGKSGEIIWVESVARPAPFIAPDARLVLCLDVTPREVEHRSLSRRATELTKANEDLDRFAAIASHDLQEPLRMIASFADVLRGRLANRLDTQEQSYFEFIHDGAARMQRLLSDLLQYSRAGSRAMRLSPVNAGMSLRMALANLRLEIDRSGSTVEFPALPCVAGDETLLVMVFQNLIGNAIKHRGTTPPVIRVTASRDEYHWQFCVADNGAGVPADMRGEVFDIFRRGPQRAEGPRGGGVGLAICQRAIQRMGGKIWLEEAEGGTGLAVNFVLPAADFAEVAAISDVVREPKPNAGECLSERST